MWKLSYVACEYFNINVNKQSEPKPAIIQLFCDKLTTPLLNYTKWMLHMGDLESSLCPLGRFSKSQASWQKPLQSFPPCLSTHNLIHRTLIALFHIPTCDKNAYITTLHDHSDYLRSLSDKRKHSLKGDNYLISFFSPVHFRLEFIYNPKYLRNESSLDSNLLFICSI